MRLWSGPEVLDLGPPKRRMVLAALMVDAGRPVPVDSLVDRVWGDAPPAEARNALYGHVNRIRRMLRQVGGKDGGARITRRDGGYVLEVNHHQVDLHLFRRLVIRARAAETGDRERASLLREALALWQGEPLAGLTGAWPTRVRETCHRQRLDAAIGWARTELRLGNHDVVLTRVPDLLAEYPLAEPLTAVLMRALEAAGRGNEAVSVYHALRHRLVEELGVEPGPELTELYLAGLRPEGSRPPSDPDACMPIRVAGPDPSAPIRSARLDQPAVTDHPNSPPEPADPPEAPGPWPVPAQLPNNLSGFTGHDTELARLDAVLDNSAEQAGAAPVVVLSGTPGVGKTTLAVHWAHRVAHRFPDGQLYVNLRGHHHSGTAMEPGDGLREFLAALGTPPERIPDTLDAQAALYRSLLAGRRILILLDNARHADQVRPLLPAAAGCLAVVTSRVELPGLVTTAGAHPLVVGLFSRAEAEQLLRRRLGDARVAAEPDAARDIVDACARLPLALAVAAARAAVRPAFPLRAIAAELCRQPAGPAADLAGRSRAATDLDAAAGAADRSAFAGAVTDLDAFAAADPATDLRAVFAWSYRCLSPPAARLFRLLGLHPGPDVSTAAAASLAGLPPHQVRSPLAELTRAHLASEQAPGRFVLHDLLRVYAAELAVGAGKPAGRHPALRRTLDHYLHTAHRAARLLQPARQPIKLAPPTAGTTPEPLDGAEAALDWFAAERRGLLSAVRTAARSGSGTHAWQLAWTLGEYLDRRGHWHDWAEVQRIALDCAEREADPVGRAHAHRDLGRVQALLGHFSQAYQNLCASLALFTAADDLVGQAQVEHSLGGWMCLRQRPGQALRHAERSLVLFRAADDKAGQAASLNAIGWYQAELGEYRAAWRRCAEALALQEGLGDPRNQASTLDSLGHILRQLGEHQRAADHYREAARRYRKLGDRYFEAGVLTRLGDLRHATNEPEDARRHWAKALAIMEELNHPDTAALHTRLRARHPPPGR